MGHLVVIGGGIIGTMHAWFARQHGWTVTQLERDQGPRSASVRNFGLVWVSGRAPGEELDFALRARELWGQVGTAIPATGFRPNGSLTVAMDVTELQALEAAAALADADLRQFEVITGDRLAAVNPSVAGDVIGALHCPLDAAVEPRLALGAIRTALEARDGDEFRPGRTVVEVADGVATDHLGVEHEGDAFVIASGDVFDVLFPERFAAAALRRCRLQMMQTAPLPAELTTSIADIDSLRFYPGFGDIADRILPQPGELVEGWRMQLLVQQRLDGSLSIGDTHSYDEPFDFALDHEPYDHLGKRVEQILGRPLPPVRRRWAGVYSQTTDGTIAFRDEPCPGVHVVTGLAGRGMTLSPAIAEQTIALL